MLPLTEPRTHVFALTISGAGRARNANTMAQGGECSSDARPTPHLEAT